MTDISHSTGNNRATAGQADRSIFIGSDVGGCGAAHAAPPMWLRMIDPPSPPAGGRLCVRPHLISMTGRKGGSVAVSVERLAGALKCRVRPGGLRWALGPPSRACGGAGRGRGGRRLPSRLSRHATVPAPSAR